MVIPSTIPFAKGKLNNGYLPFLGFILILPIFISKSDGERYFFLGFGFVWKGHVVVTHCDNSDAVMCALKPQGHFTFGI